MKNGKKKGKIILGVTALAAALAVAAGMFFYRSGKKKTDSLNNRYCPTMFGNLNYSDNGVFYYGNNGISYLDAETGREVSICTKAGCRHEDTSCPAKVEALYRTGIVYDGKKLYYISDSDAQELESLYLTECDINGSNKKKLADFEGLQSPQAIAYYGDYVIIAYMNGFDWKKREEISNREAGIYVYNRKTKEGGKIYHSTEWANLVSSLDVIDGDIYFCRSYSPLSEEEIMRQEAEESGEVLTEVDELYRVPLEGGETEYIADKISVSVSGVTGIGDMVLYSTEEGLQAYFPKTKKTKTIKEGERIYNVTSRLSDGKAVVRQVTEDGENSDYYIYDKDSLEWIGNTPLVLLAVYDNATYAIDKNGWVTLDTKKWQKGDFEVCYSFQAK